MAKAWERQLGETLKAYQAFATYRDMGDDRSIRKVAQELGKSKTLMDKWSSQWRWVERVAAWQAYMDAEARKAQIKAVRDMRDRHIKESLALQQKAMLRLQMMLPNELTPNDVLKFFLEAAKLERISRGEPETITQAEVTGKDGGPIRQEVTAAVNLQNLSDEDLAALEKLVSKANQPPPAPA